MSHSYITSSRLTPRALNGTIVPFISLAFLSGIPRVFDPIVLEVWNTFGSTPMPPYLLTIASVFGWISVGAGIVKYFASEDLAQELRIEGEVKTFGTEDLPILALLLLAGYTSMVILQVPINQTTIARTSVMLVLAMSYITVPWYLWSFAELPEQTEDLVVKTAVFLGAILIAGAFTTLAVLVMQFL